MAQWRGQFSGRTHGTLVEGLESSLRAMIESYRLLSTEAERASRLAALHAAAARVHHARVKCLKARLVAAESAALSAQLRDKRAREIVSLRRRLKRLEEAGPEATLAEFGLAMV